MAKDVELTVGAEVVVAFVEKASNKTGFALAPGPGKNVIFMNGRVSALPETGKKSGRKYPRVEITSGPLTGQELTLGEDRLFSNRKAADAGLSARAESKTAKAA